MRILQRLIFALSISFLLVKESHGAATNATNSSSATGGGCIDSSSCGINGHCGSKGECVCNNGFTGNDCSISYQVCEDGETVCYFGAQCMTSARMDTLQQASIFHCDCSHAESISAAAGSRCRNSNFDNCIPNLVGYSYAYCINGGTCRAIIADGDPDPGCNCQDGTSGQHCEYTSSSTNSAETSSAGSGGGGLSGLMKFYVVMIVLGGVLSLAAIAIILQRRRNRNMFQKESLQDLHLEPKTASDEHTLNVEEVEIA